MSFSAAYWPRSELNVNCHVPLRLIQSGRSKSGRGCSGSGMDWANEVAMESARRVRMVKMSFILLGYCSLDGCDGDTLALPNVAATRMLEGLFFGVQR